ncbi:MAG: hypothetical protein V1796_09100 [Pseudomonadota bacterium]
MPTTNAPFWPAFPTGQKRMVSSFSRSKDCNHNKQMPKLMGNFPKISPGVIIAAPALALSAIRAVDCGPSEEKWQMTRAIFFIFLDIGNVHIRIRENAGRGRCR